MQSPTKNSGDSVLVLIPAYNEAQRIEPVIAEATKHLEVCVVNDGSSDNTSQIAEQAGARVISLRANQGKGAALKAGFRHAIDQGFEASLTLDADGQHDPAEIPKFIKAFRDHRAELIIGARDFKDMPPVRRAANWLGKGVFSWAMGRTIPDNQSGYRLIGRRLMQDMLDSEQEGFEFEVEMIVTCVQREYELNWVKIRTIYAGESSHINPAKHLVNYLALVAKTRRSVRNSDQ